MLQVNDTSFEPSMGMPGLMSYVVDGVSRMRFTFELKGMN